MSDQRLLLGIDLGTTGVKSLLLREDGTVAGSATVEIGALHPTARLE